MPATQKIITRLHERRQIETELRRMLALGSERAMRQQAQRIAAFGPEVIPTLIGNLDRADSQMLAAMGLVATFLDREEVVSALRQAVLQPQRSDQGRVAAMTILERFLGQPPDDTLLESLENPERVALSALEEVLRQVDRNPVLLIEYVRGLDQQEPDVVLAVVRALQERREPACVEPLRMMAQDVRQEIAAAALTALGKVRLPEAAWALQTLIPIVHPELRPQAERMERKLRFAGVPVRPLPAHDPNWRALVSPPSGLGRRELWFILPDRQTARTRFLDIVLDDRAGAVEARGQEHISPLMLPLRRPLGQVHYLPGPEGALLMLETTFDLGRRWVRETLPLNWETQIPVTGVLRLLSPWLWGVAGADDLPARQLPTLPEETRAAAVRESAWLLSHPALRTWTLGSNALVQAAEGPLRRLYRSGEAGVRRLADALLAEEPVRRALRRRLLTLSEWFFLAGEEGMARLALATGQAIVRESPRRIPFVLALIRRDLERAAD